MELFSSEHHWRRCQPLRNLSVVGAARLLGVGIPPVSLVLLAATLWYLMTQRRQPLTWAIWPFLLVHCVIAHKELRFFVSIYWMLPLLLAVFWDGVLSKSQWARQLRTPFVLLNLPVGLTLALLPQNRDVAFWGKCGIAWNSVTLRSSCGRSLFPCNESFGVSVCTSRPADGLLRSSFGTSDGTSTGHHAGRGAATGPLPAAHFRGRKSTVSSGTGEGGPSSVQADSVVVWGVAVDSALCPARFTSAHQTMVSV